MDNEQQFLPPRKVIQLLGISYSTLRRWHLENKIDTVVTHSGRRLYSVSKILKKEEISNGKKICYCRVSTLKQQSDLNNQIEFCQKKFPNHQIVSDISSGLNWQRQGLLTILEQAMQGLVSEVVVTNKDRLSRFDFEFLQWLFQKYQVKLVVLDQTCESQTEELANDILSIITVFPS